MLGPVGQVGMELRDFSLLAGPCSAPLSTRDWLAEFQTYLLGFTSFENQSRFSPWALCPPVTLSLSFPGPFTFALWVLAAE